MEKVHKDGDSLDGKPGEGTGPLGITGHACTLPEAGDSKLPINERRLRMHLLSSP